MTQVFLHGAIEVTHLEKGTFKVNERRLTPYFEGEINMRKTTIVFHPT